LSLTNSKSKKKTLPQPSAFAISFSN